MYTYLECVPCFLRQALDASRMVSDDPAVHEHVVRETLRLVTNMPFDRSPPWMGQRIHRLLREATANPDPYRERKEYSNKLAMSLYPDLKERIRTSADPFEMAVRVAIAGNIIDFGCHSNVTDEDLHRSIDHAIENPLDATAVDELRQAVDEADDILYLADNAGEIVSDRLLIEELPEDRVTLVVRGEPVINDATREDASAAGLAALLPVMDNGSDVPGTIVEACSPMFQKRFAECDLAIAKGQGNFETLCGNGHDRVFFLFKAKCPVIARHIGGEVGRMVVRRNRTRDDEKA